MHVIAANAPVSLAAHTDAMEVFADQAINVTSTNNAILVEAQQKIVLQAGQSAIMLDGGNITFTCPGTFSVKGVAHQFSGGGSDAASLGALPSATLDVAPTDIEILHAYHDDEGVNGAAYTATLADGSVRQGKTDGQGKVLLSNVPPGGGEIQFKPDSRPFEMKAVTDNPVHKPTLTDTDIDQLLQQHWEQT
jgi:type VI secretion system secreted protein VgrG